VLNLLRVKYSDEIPDRKLIFRFPDALQPDLDQKGREGLLLIANAHNITIIIFDLLTDFRSNLPRVDATAIPLQEITCKPIFAENTSVKYHATAIFKSRTAVGDSLQLVEVGGVGIEVETTIDAEFVINFGNLGEGGHIT